MKSTLLILSLLLSLSGSSVLFAATVDVSVDPGNSTATLGGSFMVNIVGNYAGPTSLAGGSIDLSFNPSVLNLLSATVNPLVSDIASSAGTIDNNVGTLGTVGFASFFGVTGVFTIASLEFQAVGTGLSELILSDSLSPVFTWANFDFQAGPFGDSVTPIFADGSTTVVPIPAASFLFLSAVATFGVLRRSGHVT